MATKTQKRAICPICGGAYAVRNGKYIAEHGYRMMHGWKATGSCAGTNKPHFGTEEGREFARNFAEQTIEDMIIGLSAKQNEKNWQYKINSMKHFQKDLLHRVEAWKPQEPVTVPVETKEPAVHLYGKPYGVNYGKVCAASAMGAQRSVSSRGTDDETKVTCTRCLAWMKRRDARIAKKAAEASNN